MTLCCGLSVYKNAVFLHINMARSCLIKLRKLTTSPVVEHKNQFNLIREVSRFLNGSKTRLFWQGYKLIPRRHESDDKVMSK